MSRYDLPKMMKKLEKYLDEDRYAHTMGVMYMCAALAMAHGYDLNAAQTAGLLHDCAKCIPNKKKLKLCEQHQIQLTDFEKNHPVLIHAKLGAYIAEEKYDIVDPEILSSIVWHTTGKPAMTKLEKIVYIADYIEPSRCKAENLPDVRRLAFHDLNLTVCRILEDTLHYLDSGHGEIDPMSRSAYRYYHNLFFETEDKGSSLTV